MNLLNRLWKNKSFLPKEHINLLIKDQEEIWIESLRRLNPHDRNLAIFDMCSFGRSDLLKIIANSKLKINVNFNLTNGGFLGVAAHHNHLSVIKILLKRSFFSKIDIRAENNIALRLACSRGNIEVIDYLIFSKEIKNKEHANINGVEIHESPGYGVPLLKAVENEQKNTILWLIENDVDIYANNHAALIKAVELKNQCAPILIKSYQEKRKDDLLKNIVHFTNKYPQDEAYRIKSELEYLFMNEKFPSKETPKDQIIKL